jgi:pimeloyl-ACP methyl ester carboxylesterase
MKYVLSSQKTNFRYKLLGIALIYLGLVLLLAASCSRVSAQNTGPKKTVVLVHGLFADGLSWSKITPLLQAKGLNVVAANDRMISPEIERATAKKINATVTVLQPSHVPMLSKPKEVADIIFAAGGMSKK